MYLPTRAISSDRLGRLDPIDEGTPRIEVGGDLRVAEAELADDEPPETGGLEHERDLVDRGRRLRRDDGLHRHIGEQRDLLADLVRDGMVGTQDDDVGLDADAAKLLDRVLRRLRLELARGSQRGEERHVDVQDVGAPDVLAHLADGLEERQRFDVADGPADLDDDDVRVPVPGDAPDPFLDLVGDVRDDLHGPTEVVAATFLGDDRLVDAGRS